MRFKSTFFLIFFVAMRSFAQNLPVPPQPVQMDSLFANNPDGNFDSIYITNNQIFPKKFAEKFRSKYRTPDFDYTTTKPRESLWQKLEKRIIKILESVLGKMDPLKSATYATYILRFFAIVVAALVLYLIIRFLLNKNGNLFLAKKNPKLIRGDQQLHENIHELDFAKIIADFEDQKNFRAAIRYRFLFLLKNLADRNLVQWNPEKTNKDYLRELKSTELKNAFRELVYIFEYVWYGEFEVSDNQYEIFKQKFLALSDGR